MVIRVPHLGYDPLSVCWQRYSLLGFGDILVPGMLVGFCHGFDLATANRRKLYYISTLIGEFILIGEKSKTEARFHSDFRA